MRSSLLVLAALLLGPLALLAALYAAAQPARRMDVV